MNGLMVAALAAVGFLVLGDSDAAAAVIDAESPIPLPNPAPGNGDTPVPDYSQDRFIELFNQYGPQYGVSPLWLQAFCMNESSMGQDPSVMAGELSADGLSKGIMQLTLATARDFEPITSLDDLNDPETSVRIATRLIAQIQTSFSTPDTRYVEWCVKSYNRGVARTQQEQAGDPKGLAEPGFTNGNTYWARWQRNYASIGGTL